MHTAPGLALTLASAFLASVSANAADPSPVATGSERRLSPEQVQQVLDEAARRREGAGSLADPSTAENAAVPIPIHGEVGFSIGTGGYRSAYGTAVVGLPGQGTAMLSIGTDRLPDDHFFPYW